MDKIEKFLNDHREAKVEFGHNLEDSIICKITMGNITAAAVYPTIKRCAGEARDIFLDAIELTGDDFTFWKGEADIIYFDYDSVYGNYYCEVIKDSKIVARSWGERCRRVDQAFKLAIEKGPMPAFDGERCQVQTPFHQEICTKHKGHKGDHESQAEEQEEMPEYKETPCTGEAPLCPKCKSKSWVYIRSSPPPYGCSECEHTFWAHRDDDEGH